MKKLIEHTICDICMKKDATYKCYFCKKDVCINCIREIRIDNNNNLRYIFLCEKCHVEYVKELENKYGKIER